MSSYEHWYIYGSTIIIIPIVTVAQQGQSARLLTEWSGVQIPLVIFKTCQSINDFIHVV